MIEDLTMIANLPVADIDAAAQAKAEADKAAAGETMPPPKCPENDAEDMARSEADRVARRGQDPPDDNPGQPVS